MKTSLRFSMLISVLALAALAACSSKITSDGAGLSTATDNKFSDTIQGPSLDGTWVSQCTNDWQQDGVYETVTMQINGRSISRAESLFSDEDCTQAQAGGQTETGLFRYMSMNAEGAYQLEYRFYMPNGWYTEYENMTFTNSQLSISNEVGGDGDANLAMTHTGFTPPPVPTPVGPMPPGQIINIGTYSASAGDTASYLGTAYGVQQSEVYTNIEPYEDDEEGNWIISIVINQGTTPIENDEGAESSWSSANTRSTFASCVGNGGTLETITVAAGTFNTCRETDDTRTIWYGDVPVLGMVKVQNLDGNYSTELQSFHWGPTKASQPVAPKHKLQGKRLKISALSISKSLR